MATLRVRGTRDLTAAASELDSARNADRVRVRVKHAVKVQRARAAAVALDLAGVEPDDVVELELEDGVRLWSRVDDFVRDFGIGAGRAAAGDAIEVPTTLALAPQVTRGLGGYAIQAL